MTNRANVRIVVMAALLLLTISSMANAKTIYVDLALGANCQTYNPENRSCDNGTDAAYHTLSEGLNAAGAGDTVLLRSGNYEQLNPPISGAPESPVTINAYPGEVPVISNLSSIAIWLEDRAYITIEGITIKNCKS